MCEKAATASACAWLDVKISVAEAGAFEMNNDYYCSMRLRAPVLTYPGRWQVADTGLAPIYVRCRGQGAATLPSFGNTPMTPEHVAQ